MDTTYALIANSSGEIRGCVQALPLPRSASMLIEYIGSHWCVLLYRSQNSRRLSNRYLVFSLVLIGLQSLPSRQILWLGALQNREEVPSRLRYRKQKYFLTNLHNFQRGRASVVVVDDVDCAPDADDVVEAARSVVALSSLFFDDAELCETRAATHTISPRRFTFYHESDDLLSHLDGRDASAFVPRCSSERPKRKASWPVRLRLRMDVERSRTQDHLAVVGTAIKRK